MRDEPRAPAHWTLRVLATAIVCAARLLLASPAAAQDPEIAITDLPGYGTTENLFGEVLGLEVPTDFQVCTYGFLEGGGWWVKPTSADPGTPIEPDGTFEVDVTTGGCDEYFGEFALYLLPLDCGGDVECECADARGTPVPPMDDDPDVVTSLRVDRYPFLDTPIHAFGREWIQKDSGEASDFCRRGPGGNLFLPDNAWADAEGLHLAISEDAGTWWASEVWLDGVTGYGEYVVHTKGRVDDLDPQIVFGLFTWDNDAPPCHAEVDLEFSRWANPMAEDNAQFVVTPVDGCPLGDIYPFSFAQTDLDDELTYVVLWRPGEVEFALYRGHHFSDPPDGDLIDSWVFEGDEVPAEAAAGFRFNLWLVNGLAPQDLAEEEVLVTHFDHRTVPVGIVTGDECPGPVTLELEDLTPGGSVVILRGTSEGTTVVPSGQCAGTELDLADPTLLTALTADAEGRVTIDRTLPGGACGLLLQAIDLGSCEASNLIRLPTGTAEPTPQPAASEPRAESAGGARPHAGER